MYGKDVVSVVEKHDPAQPLFVYLPLHDTHGPYQCTDRWMDPRVTQPLRQLMQCMLTCTDDIVGQVVAKLKAKEMWGNSVMVPTPRHKYHYRNSGLSEVYVNLVYVLRYRY